MTTTLDQSLESQREAADAIRLQAPEKMAGEDEAFLYFAYDVVYNHAQKLFLVWDFMLLQMEKGGGVSAKRLLHRCDLLLALLEAPKELLPAMADSLAKRPLPDELLLPLRSQIARAQSRIPEIEQGVRQLRRRLELPTSTATAAEVQERFDRTEAEGTWLRLEK